LLLEGTSPHKPFFNEKPSLDHFRVSARVPTSTFLMNVVAINPHGFLVLQRASLLERHKFGNGQRFAPKRIRNASGLQSINPNSKTIEALSKMRAFYERTNDRWRALSYRKVIFHLEKHQDVCWYGIASKGVRTFL